MLYAVIKKKLKDFCLDIKIETNNDIVGLLGASGCGKSMTLKCIAGIENPDEGKIVVNDRVLFDSEKKINLTPQKRNVGYLFQNYALFPNMTVDQNIGIGLKLGKNEKMQIVAEKIKMLHLEGLEKRYPRQLSGGQQQRVALARVLAYNPEVLMLDEPFSALDAYLKDQLQQQLLDALVNYKGDTLIVTHSRDEVYKLCSNISIIENGEMVLEGNTLDIFKNPRKLAAARLTGCKNISRAKKISEGKVYAMDWDVILNVTAQTLENINYVGIRAHDLVISDNMVENTQKYKFVRAVNNPFDTTVIVKCENTNAELWLTVSNNISNGVNSNSMYIYVSFPSESIMLFE